MFAGSLLMPFCGYYARDHSGVYYRQRMVNGIASSSVFHVGASMAYGGKFSVTFLKMLIYRIFLWMVQSLGRMPARLERQIALLRMKRWGVPKTGLVVRFMRFVMPWACQ